MTKELKKAIDEANDILWQFKQVMSLTADKGIDRLYSLIATIESALSTDKTLEVVKRKRDYEIQRANEFDNSMFPPNFYWEHQGAVNVLNSIIAEIEGDK